MSDINRDPAAAWQWLCEKGGLEVEGRDLPLVMSIKDRLDPLAETLDQALSAVSMSHFLNSFFGSVSPYVGMMRDLLAYFEAAEATEGPTQWILVLGEGEEALDFDLEAFKRWISRYDTPRPDMRSVPVLDYKGLWKLREHFFPLASGYSSAETYPAQPTPRVQEPELAVWLSAYERGQYLPLPSIVGQILTEDGPAGDVAALLVEIYETILSVARTRTELQEKGHSAPSQSNDFWGLRNLWYFESDYWVRGRVFDLISWRQAQPALRTTVEEGLGRQFANLPRRRTRVGVRLTDLEEILSLPAWHRRHELYSDWILTLLLGAIRDHDIELHHEKGRIAFAFRERLLATIHSKIPTLGVYAERKTAATDLVGHGRKAAVQPDYTVWPIDSGSCKLAVECKQYKTSSTRNFADALNDYASALSAARVVLANYGPVSQSVHDAIEKNRRGRCVAIGFVHPEEPKACQKFCENIKEVIGKPDTLAPRTNLSLSTSVNPKTDLLVVDVSGSARPALDSPTGRQLIETVIKRLEITRLAAADNRLVFETEVANCSIAEFLSHTGTGQTDLNPPVSALLRKQAAVFVLADEEGIQTLPAIVRRLGSFDLGALTFHIAHVS
jgi:hypothetical protein